MVSGAKKEFWACVTRVEKAGKRRRRRGRPFTPLPGGGLFETRVTGGEFVAREEEGRTPKRRAMVSGAEIASWCFCKIRKPCVTRVTGLGEEFLGRERRERRARRCGLGGEREKALPGGARLDKNSRDGKFLTGDENTQTGQRRATGLRANGGG